MNSEKAALALRESLGNNSQLQNTKQIIKLIKKAENHSNYDVTLGSRNPFQQIEAQVPSSQS